MQIPKRIPDNSVREGINKIKKDIENETDTRRRLKLIEQMNMYGLFSMNNGGYEKYKNPW